MATRIAVATGNWTSAGTWLTVDATSLSDSEANNTALTTSYTNSAAFTPGAITVDGLAIKVASRATGTPTNTITVRLGQAGADVAGTVTTMNVSDLPQCDNTNKEGGWVYFRFNVSGTPTPVTLLAATAYTVGAKLSATTTAVNLFRTSTATDWSRMLATTTTGSPGAADILHIMGDNLAAGTKNSYTVTMNNTASTTFGVAANTTGCLTVSNGGTLTWGTTASTAYLLKVAGTIYVYSGGTWNQGTSGTRMPSTSSGALQFAITSNVDGGMWVKAGATFNAYGATKTTKWTYMTADKAAAATTLTVTSTAGWSANDQICIASTSRTYTQAELRTIQSVDSSTTLTMTAGLTNAHSGTSPTQAEVGNLTRNVSIFGTSTSLQGYVRFDTTAVVNCDSVEFYWLGSATASKRGITLGTTTGTCNITGCSFHDFMVASSGLVSTDAAFSGTAFTTCVFWSVYSGFILAATTGTWTITGCLIVGGTSTSAGALLSLTDVGGTFTNNNIANAKTYGIDILEPSATFGAFSGNIIHTCGSSCFILDSSYLSGSISFTSLYRSQAGFGTNSCGVCNGLEVSLGSVFGHSIAGAYLSSSMVGSGIVLSNGVFAGDSTFSQPFGFQHNQNASAFGEVIKDSTFGVASGIMVAHSTADIDITVIAGNVSLGVITLRNCLLSSSTEINTVASLGVINSGTAIVSQKHDQTDGLNKRWEKYGIVSTDTTTYRTSSPSIAITPNNASNKIRATMPQRHFEVPVDSGQSVTFTCYVQKSASYNGNQPRLLLLSNSAVGITADVVLATASGGTDSWLTLTGTTAAVTAKGVLEFTVDCDGTAGTVYVSDISVSGVSAKDTTSPAYWHDGQPVVISPAPLTGCYTPFSGGQMIGM